jgi:glycosyltransferase involved in cell wall biosynthesis
MSRGVRLAVLDDGIFLRTAEGSIHPAAATFHRFVEAVASSGSFERVRYMVPVRRLGPNEPAPILPAVNEQLLEVVPTAPFRGIADYVLRAGWLSIRNWPAIARTVSEADLVWVRLPASNGLLTLVACRRSRVAHFGWLAGSVREVVAGQARPVPIAGPAHFVAAGYDAVSRLAARSGPLVRLDDEMFTSVVSRAEMDALGRSRPVRRQGPWRIVWAGRIAPEKQLDLLIRTVALLIEDGLELRLAVIGDGPARSQAEQAARGLPAGRVTFHGYVGDRATYLDLLRRGDVFVNTSSAEGVPKVLIEAMAAGVPVVATAVGAVPEILDHGQRGVLAPPADAAGLAVAVRALLENPAERKALRMRGLEFARAHTVEAQANRLVRLLRHRFPMLDWPPPP